MIDPIEILEVVLDIETVANEDAVNREAELMPIPRAPANYKDPAKIAQYCQQERNRKIGELHRAAALDWRTCKIVAVGVNDQCFCGPNEHDILYSVTDALSKTERLVTFNGYDFDLRVLRNRFLCQGMKVPSCIWKTRRYDSTHHVDVRMELSNWDMRAPGNLGSCYFAMFGEEMEQPETTFLTPITGAMVGQLYEEGRFSEIVLHCMADVKATRRIYEVLKSCGVV